MRLRSLLVVLLLNSSLLLAQSFRGGIDGTVADSSGAALTGATVTVTNTDTGLTRSAQTGDTGDFTFSELPLGTYKVSAQKTGFRTAVQTGVTVGVTTHPHLDFNLTPGAVKETVEVSADVPLVDVTTDTQGGTIEGKQAAELPVNGRDFTKLLVMVPGAAGDPSGATDSPGSFGLFSANGNRGRSNNYLLDGTDMNDGYRNLPAINEAGVFGTPATILPVDALAEVPVISGADAEFGRNSGAIVNLVTKSGTNDWHGSVYEYFRNNALDARNFFNTEPDAQNPFHNNQFGGSLGGPLVKDRTFFFVAYEGQRETGGTTSHITVPTQADIAGAGGVSNPVVASLLAADPWHLGGPLPATNGNLTETIPFSNNISSVVAKIDQHVGSGDILTGRYFFGTSDQSFPLALVGGGTAPVKGYNTVTPTTVHVLSLSYTHLFSPKLLMEARGGYNHFFENFLPEDHSFDPNSIGLATIPSSDTLDFGMPLIRISGFSPFGSNAGNPRGRNDANTQFFDNVSYTNGRHNWKAGFEYRRTTVDQFFDAGYRSALSFGSLDSFVSGQIDSFSRQARGNSRRNTAQNNFAFYGQDSFRLTPRLTLNLGLRWDYYGVISEAKDRWSILDPTVSGGGLKQVSQIYPKDLNNFAPRLSFAWDMFGTGKTVLRAGWGIYYDAFSQDFFIGQLPFNTFNPGPAYNNAGPDPIQFGFLFGGDAAGGANVVLTPGVNPFDPGGGTTFYCPVYVPCDAFTVNQNLRTPYIQNYNVNLEQQLGRAVALQIAYVGSNGRKLFRYRDLNQNNPATPGFSPGCCFPFPNIGYLNSFESTASSNYNSLQVSLKTRTWHGLTSLLAYTWSHSIDNASDGQDYVAQATQPDNSFNPGAERANSNFDMRHHFVWNFNYKFPTTHHWYSNGWALDGVLSLNSGQPYNLTYQFEGDFNGSFEFFGRPDLIPGANPFAGTGGLNLLNLSAFAAPCNYDATVGDCTSGWHFGNLGRNAFVGPTYRNFDFSLVKDTKITERINLQWRADFFNIFNHPNLSNPTLPNFAVDFLGNGGVPTNPTGVGLLTGTGFLQPTATPDVGIGNPFLGGGGPRNIQLAVRFSF